VLLTAARRLPLADAKLVWALLAFRRIVSGEVDGLSLVASKRINEQLTSPSGRISSACGVLPRKNSNYISDGTKHATGAW
jgi:hypothetical protein